MAALVTLTQRSFPHPPVETKADKKRRLERELVFLQNEMRRLASEIIRVSGALGQVS